MKIKEFVMAAAVLASCCFVTSCNKEIKVNYQTGKVERQNITTSITATGTIEPVTKVEVGTQVSGIINKIYVDYNSIVQKGQVIAELDKTNLESELVSAQNNLMNAQSNLNYQIENYKRYQALYDKELVSANDFESARLSYEQASAQVKVQQQNVQKARTNLGYATIMAPIDGVVLSKEVEEGQTVASAMTTPKLFIIAKDLTDMRVIADIDEADIGGVKEGQRVAFTVDAYPEDNFNGEVTQVRQQATTESNVVTYQVVISAPNPDLKLKPGLTANVTIYTLEKENVLTIPTKSLRFAPNETLLKEGETIEDCESKQKVWMKQGNKFKAIAVNTGISNGTLTEVLDGVKDGDEIITEVEIQNPMVEAAERSPFMPGPRNNKKDGKQGKPDSKK